MTPTTSGQPLHGPLQAKMEGAFGADFSGVRVHQGQHVADAGARAFTRGDDVHFAHKRGFVAKTSARTATHDEVLRQLRELARRRLR